MLYNIKPSLWGSHFWRSMHYLTVAYPDNPTDDDKRNAEKFFLSVGNILPCQTCRVHFAQNLQRYPLTANVLSCRYNLINWLNDIHNEVNTRTNKKRWTYDDIIAEYTTQPKQSYTIELITIFLLILLMVIIIVYMKRQKY